MVHCDMPPPPSLSLLQCRMVCKDVSAETMYDVLHDIDYRRKWDSNVIETFDIGKLTVNADVGYYSCKQVSHNSVHFTYVMFRILHQLLSC